MSVDPDGITPGSLKALRARAWSLPEKIGIPATIIGVVLLSIGGFLRDDVLTKIAEDRKRIDAIDQRQIEREREAIVDKERIIRLEAAQASQARSIERIEIGIERLNVKIDEMRGHRMGSP